jgi:hypothetical protein
MKQLKYNLKKLFGKRDVFPLNCGTTDKIMTCNYFFSVASANWEQERGIRLVLKLKTYAVC